MTERACFPDPPWDCLMVTVSFRCLFQTSANALLIVT
jgi:hypothetical protein